jgi:hypothetical protein
MAGLWAAIGPVVKLLVEALAGVFIDRATEPDTAELSRGWDEKQVKSMRRRVARHFGL